MSAEPVPIRHPLLLDRGVEHGFGVRGWTGPRGLARPEQVHGTDVAMALLRGGLSRPVADAVLSSEGGPPVGVVTADCVPILLASRDGARVGAIHAGWRGLAAGVVGAALAEWRRVWGEEPGLIAAVGPHAGPCCYEVDAAVRDAFDHVEVAVHRRAFGASRPGHWMADLACLAREALERGGVAEDHVGVVEGACTICDPRRFESYRRDGAAAGRLVHAVVPGPAPEGCRDERA